MPEHAPDPPTNAYEVLQLDPRASEELIQASYWLLARLITVTPLENPNPTWPTRHELNAAYEALAQQDNRARYDSEYGYDRRRAAIRVIETRRGLFGRSRGLVVGANHYRILHVHPLAHPELVHAAYRIRRSELAGADRITAAQREKLDEAYATLRDPERRAAYDRTRVYLMADALTEARGQGERHEAGGDDPATANRVLAGENPKELTLSATQVDLATQGVATTPNGQDHSESRDIFKTLEQITNRLFRRRNSLEQRLSERLARLKSPASAHRVSEALIGSLARRDSPEEAPSNLGAAVSDVEIERAEQ